MNLQHPVLIYLARAFSRGAIELQNDRRDAGAAQALAPAGPDEVLRRLAAIGRVSADALTRDALTPNTVQARRDLRQTLREIVRLAETGPVRPAVLPCPDWSKASPPRPAIDQ